MATHYVRAQVTIPLDSNIALDAITNTWHFVGGEPLSTVGDVCDDALAKLQTFYEALALNIMPASIASSFVVKWYNLSDAEPRDLFRTDAIPVTPGNDDSLPTEVAICMSFKGTDAGVPVERQRGRIFLGPIQKSSIVQGGGKTHIITALVDRIADAGEILMNSTDDLSAWSVYSPTMHKGRGATSGGRPGGRGPSPAVAPHTLDQSTFDVEQVWVDNAWDTIRSRGQVATLRDVRNRA